MQNVKKHTYESIKQRIPPPENELEVDEGTREPLEEQLENEDEATEELKEENVNETERWDNTGLIEKAKLDERLESESGEKPVKNVTKLLQNRTGFKDTQIVNPKSGEKPVQNVTKLTYEDIKQRIPQRSNMRMKMMLPKI